MVSRAGALPGSLAVSSFLPSRRPRTRTPAPFGAAAKLADISWPLSRTFRLADAVPEIVTRISPPLTRSGRVGTVPRISAPFRPESAPLACDRQQANAAQRTSRQAGLTMGETGHGVSRAPQS